MNAITPVPLLTAFEMCLLTGEKLPVLPLHYPNKIVHYRNGYRTVVETPGLPLDLRSLLVGKTNAEISAQDIASEAKQAIIKAALSSRRQSTTTQQLRALGLEKKTSSEDSIITPSAPIAIAETPVLAPVNTSPVVAPSFDSGPLETALKPRWKLSDTLRDAIITRLQATTFDLPDLMVIMVSHGCPDSTSREMARRVLRYLLAEDRLIMRKTRTENWPNGRLTTTYQIRDSQSIANA